MFDALEKSFKKNGLNTTREGNNITIQGLAKETKKPTEAERQAIQEAKDAMIRKEEEARGLKMTTKDTMGHGNSMVVPSNFNKSLGVGSPQKKAKGGLVKSSASRRADGAAKRGRTKGRTL